MGAKVQALEQGRRRVESLAELLQYGCVVKPRKFRHLRRVLWNRLGKRPRDVLRGDPIGDDRFNCTGAECLEQCLAARAPGESRRAVSNAARAWRLFFPPFPSISPGEK